jgi:ABC-type phosphate transport system substrate-binding protein
MQFAKLRHLAALIGVSTFALVAPTMAQASFTPPYTTQCSGSEVEGLDTGLQADIDTTWTLDFQFDDTTSPLSCAGKGFSSGVEYDTATSSATLAELGSVKGERGPRRTVSSEEPPTLSQWASIDLGSSPGHNSGLIRQIPVASTAVVPLVSFPKGCAIPAKEATADGRFTVSNAVLEKAFAGKIATWGELLPDVQPSCASLPIKRVVPSVSDGTTFVFKQWLATIDPSLGWEESTSMPNTAWPNDSGATATERSEGGDSGEAALVGQTSGAIGFASLPKARENGFGYFSPENPFHGFQSGQFWLSVENGAGQRVEPTRDPNSGADNVKGANCDNPTFNYVPSGYDSTVTPIWRYVTAVGSKTGWPICTLTYDLAWDDASTVYGNTAAEQAKQRTIKDYLGYVLGAAGQQEAEEEDYSRLPQSLLADAQEGQSNIGWNKYAESKVKAQLEADAKHT